MHYRLTFSTFQHAQRPALIVEAPAAEIAPIFAGDITASAALARYRDAGATDATLIPLSDDEYRAAFLRRLPSTIAQHIGA